LTDIIQRYMYGTNPKPDVCCAAATEFAQDCPSTGIMQ
jgi:hypothetical protein